MRPMRFLVAGILLVVSAISAAQDCSDIAGDWLGTWSETDCFGDTDSGGWSGQVTSSCNFSGGGGFDTINGTIDPLTGILTASANSAFGCGVINLTATFAGDFASGTYTYSVGGGGQFSGNKQVVDSDGDGVPDDEDAFPNDPNESVDTDSDGIGNNADTDDDGDTMPDAFESANGLDPLNAADAADDADGDGFTNLEEFEAGTDPQDAADFPVERKAPVAINILLGEDEAISYSFSTTASASGTDDPALTALFAGLSVSGTFDYTNSLPATGVTSVGPSPGSVIYGGTLTNVEGSVDGMNFSDADGITVVGNDRYVPGGLTDILTVGAGQADFSGFEIDGFTLVDVRMFWIEGQLGVVDFLSSEDLPTALPDFAGRLALDFTPTANPGVLSRVFFVGLFLSPIP